MNEDGTYTGSGGRIYNAWDHERPTNQAIRTGRPILAAEAKPLLDEIRRLKFIEQDARSMLINEEGTLRYRGQLWERLNAHTPM